MEIKQKGEESIHFDHPEKITIGIVQALWNDSITGKMAQECIDALTSHGIQGDKIIHKTVPGSFELPLGAQMMEKIGRASCREREARTGGDGAWKAKRGRRAQG